MVDPFSLVLRFRRSLVPDRWWFAAGVLTVVGVPLSSGHLYVRSAIIILSVTFILSGFWEGSRRRTSRSTRPLLVASTDRIGSHARANSVSYRLMRLASPPAIVTLVASIVAVGGALIAAGGLYQNHTEPYIKRSSTVQVATVPVTEVLGTDRDGKSVDVAVKMPDATIAEIDTSNSTFYGAIIGSKIKVAFSPANPANIVALDQVGQSPAGNAPEIGIVLAITGGSVAVGSLFFLRGKTKSSRL